MRSRRVAVVGRRRVGRVGQSNWHARDLRSADFLIVTVPTPIDASKQPDLEPLRRASTTIGQALKKGDIVVYESTVFPGVTEDVCIPVLEKASGLKWKTDFNVGYSPSASTPALLDRQSTAKGVTLWRL
jgi:UDP-N-acetyl-D-galactosamine dehydrogenase